jgi:hypothetical protein
VLGRVVKTGTVTFFPFWISFHLWVSIGVHISGLPCAGKVPSSFVRSPFWAT